MRERGWEEAAKALEAYDRDPFAFSPEVRM
jgi:hypothetical protein